MKRHGENKIKVIKSNIEFNYILRNGKIFQNNLFLIAVKEEGLLKIGFTAAKGLKAVERNRLKRILKSLWMKYKGDFHFHGEIIFLIKRKALEYKFEELDRKFKLLLGKIFEIQYIK